jgi:succinate dehydrogenase/fumarate reductase flavoprotein subunit
MVDAKAAHQDKERLEHCLKRGYVKAFSSLTDLASAYDLPNGRLEDEVADYNRLIRTGGADPLGKPLKEGAKTLDTSPFYAMRLWPKVHYTPGGVGIDARTRVLDLHGHPIPRLYAAGEVCGGIHGASRLGCCALTECIVFGRIAGRQAALADTTNFDE